MRIVYHDDDNVEYIVEYHFEGAYYPATLEDPEEFPELIIDDFYKTSDNKSIEDVPQEVYDFVIKNQ